MAKATEMDAPAGSPAPMPHLPPNVVELITTHLWGGNTPSQLFDVMSCAAVCRSWRDTCTVIGKDLDVRIICDRLEAAQPLSRRAAQFRRASLASQRAFLAGAAKLLHGPGLTGFTLRGSGVLESLVLQVRPHSV